MQRYLAIYLGSANSVNASGWNSLDETARRQREQVGMQAWGEWVRANQASIVDMGAPLGKTKRVGREGMSDVTNAMSAYVIVQAESHEAAAKLFLNHPHFAIFPGDAVEIMPCLPIPGQ